MRTCDICKKEWPERVLKCMVKTSGKTATVVWLCPVCQRVTADNNPNYYYLDRDCQCGQDQ